MKKIISKLFIISMLFINSFITVNADSGLDSNYTTSDSILEAIFSTVSSFLSFVGELISAQPGDKDYSSNHIIVAVICIMIFYIFTNKYIFNVNKKPKTKKEITTLLAINLIPTIIFSLLCLLTELQLILYIFILILYIIPLKVITKIIMKKKLKKQLAKVIEIDKNFNEEEFNKEAFNIYKEIQLAWVDSNIDKIKDIISEEIYNKYEKTLEKLNKKKEKNIMNEIEYKSNKIVYIEVENNIETIGCEMTVTCYDYIIDEKEKVMQGKKDKKYKYLYKLTFNKNLDTNKYVLVKKKMKKIK